MKVIKAKSGIKETEKFQKETEKFHKRESAVAESAQVHIYIGRELKKALDHYCIDRRCSIAWIIEQVLTDFLKEEAYCRLEIK